MSNTGTPAGWYPDPENPGQTRYWDGSSWAAPAAAATPPPAGPGGSASGGNKTAMIVVAIIAVIALIGGGIFLLTSGDDDGDDENVATDEGDDDDEDDDDEDDDGDNSDVEELAEDDFIDAADGICLDLEDDLDGISNFYFEDIPLDEFEEIPNSVFSAFEDEMLEATGDAFEEMRKIAPEGETDDWLSLVEDWEATYQDLIGAITTGDLDAPAEFQDQQKDVEERVEDFGLSCLGGGMGTDTVDPGGSTSGSSPSSGTDVGDPTSPPAFDDPSLESLGDDCFDGDFEACDDLYFDSGFDTPEEDYGDTCGGRTDGGTLCALLEVRDNG